jgi:hypothetical protein
VYEEFGVGGVNGGREFGVWDFGLKVHGLLDIIAGRGLPLLLLWGVGM